MAARKGTTMAADTKTMLAALGTPLKPMGPKPAKGSGYLAGKPAQLRSYLEDAVDQALSPEMRAEALCKAIEFKSGNAEPDADEADAEQDDESDY